MIRKFTHHDLTKKKNMNIFTKYACTIYTTLSGIRGKSGRPHIEVSKNVY